MHPVCEVNHVFQPTELWTNILIVEKYGKMSRPFPVIDRCRLSISTFICSIIVPDPVNCKRNFTNLTKS